MKDINVVVCDLDNTLLTTQKILTERTLSAISAIRAKGIKFLIASGRPIFGIEAMIRNWGLENNLDGIIGMNGGQFLDTHTKIEQEFLLLELPVLHEILEDFSGLKLNACLQLRTGIYAQRPDSKVVSIANRSRVPLVIVNMNDILTGPQGKIVFTVPENRMDEVEAFMEAHPSKNYRGFKSQKDLYEIIHPELSKSIGIAKYCETIGTDMAHVLAFGDTTNDLEMIRDCGIGVCMSNGTKDILDIADAVTSSCDEDGVAEYLEKYILS